MVASKGYGPSDGAGKGRGVYSVKSNPAPVPMKGSALNKSSSLQGPDAAKVKSMAKEQSMRESLRGKVS